MSIRPEPQATEVDFSLHTLGWRAFQQLCLTVLGEIWGQTVQGFHDSHDGGRDGAFYGQWSDHAGQSYTGSFTVQCKFSATRKPLTPSSLNDELVKAERLAKKGLCRNYFLLTNRPLTGTLDEQLSERFLAIDGIETFTIFGSEKISQLIRESARLRMLVPRIYGLGDLSQIFDARAYDQSREILSSMGDDLAKFVLTDAYRKAANALREHGFVLLLGEPASGKSTIAAALSLGALDNWRCSTLKVRDSHEFSRHFNPHEPKQFFWVDDAFGATQLDWQNTIAWNSAFPLITAAIRKGAKFVFTSRDYIYKSAKNTLKESALPVLRESQVVIEVEKLKDEEKQQILYNHIRLGTQPGDFKTRIKPFLHTVSGNKRFTPEIARRLGNPIFTKRLILDHNSLSRFIEEPMDFLREIIQNLDRISISAIALVFMRGGNLESPISLNTEEEKAVELLGGSLPDVRRSFSFLEGSMLLLVTENGRKYWRYKHPTVRDAFASLVAEDHELMDIYLAGTPLRRLLLEVSCGLDSVPGVKVVLPESRYDRFLARLIPFLNERKDNWDTVNNFLGNRCDRTFLEQFIRRVPTHIPSLRLGSYLYAISDLDALVALHKNGLLPEDERLRHVEVIRELAVHTPDAGFLGREAQSLMTAEERDEIGEAVRTELIPNLDRHIRDWRSQHNGTDDPDSHFSDLVETLSEIRKVFVRDPAAVALIDRALKRISDEVDDLLQEMPQDDDDYDPDRRSFRQQTGTWLPPRSIFDDVDE